MDPVRFTETEQLRFVPMNEVLAFSGLGLGEIGSRERQLSHVRGLTIESGVRHRQLKDCLEARVPIAAAAVNLALNQSHEMRVETALPTPRSSSHTRWGPS
jgi:hypothetical protein